jgi:hypothetical protein
MISRVLNGNICNLSDKFPYGGTDMEQLMQFTVNNLPHISYEISITKNGQIIIFRTVYKKNEFYILTNKESTVKEMLGVLGYKDPIIRLEMGNCYNLWNYLDTKIKNVEISQFVITEFRV